MSQTSQFRPLILLQFSMKQESKQSNKLFNNLTYRTPILKKTLTPNKNKILLGVTFSKQASIRTLNNSIKESNIVYNRCLTHSTEEIHHSNSVENAENRSGVKNEEGEEMFSKSYAKIQKMKNSIANKNIDEELNDILSIIKDEKHKIRHRMKQLHSYNQYYRRICEGTKTDRLDISVNTEDIISDGIEPEYVDREVQCEDLGLKECRGPEKKRKEAYAKLKTMLVEMNISPVEILPEECIDQEFTRPFKVLSDAQIIKIQQFFIRKLAAKISK